MKKVSILIPVYNVRLYLQKCLDSVIAQTYSDLQVVLIDDGSTDDSWRICQQYAEKDSRLEVYHQDNCGVATTRNRLLEKIKGDYVLFVDADDWIEPDMVQYLVGLANEYQAEVVMCDRLINDEVPVVTNPSIKILSQEKAIDDFLHHDYFVGSLWNKLIKMSLLHNEQFHRGISYGEDALFCWHLLQKVGKVVVTNKQLYHYRMNNESISHQTFGAKKLTGHLTWTLISDDVIAKWPQFTNLAKGTFARSDMYLLFQASQGDYPKDEHIKELQRNLRRNYKYLFPLIKHDIKSLIMSICEMFWYGYGRFYYKLHQYKS